MSKNPGEALSPERVEAFLRRARQAFKSQDFINGSPTHLAMDFSALGLIAHEDYVNAIGKALDEIRPEHYCGPHPPNHKSKEPKVKGSTMLQFVWKSACFADKEMYLKVCMTDRERLAVLRIHQAYNPNDYDG